MHHKLSFTVLTLLIALFSLIPTLVYLTQWLVSFQTKVTGGLFSLPHWNEVYQVTLGILLGPQILDCIFKKIYVFIHFDL